MRTRVRFSCRSYRAARMTLLAGIGLLLAGCWVPPSADVRPHGKPGVIESGIAVGRTVESARIASVDRATRTLTLGAPGIPLSTYKVEPGVLDWGEIENGDRVRATIEEDVTVYVARARRRRTPHARVLAVDPSYRLLTVQYPNGGTETFKVGLHTQMHAIEAGDSVVIRPVEVIELRVHRHRNRRESFRPGAPAMSAR